MRQRITGLVAATFTPMHSDGSLRLEAAGRMVEYLLGAGIRALYVVGSTGEGVSLTGQERRATAEAFVRAAAGRVPVIVQVGHTSLAEARELAVHAQAIGADAVSAVPPFYWKPTSAANLADCMAQVAAGAPKLPFYYYHIPAITSVGLDLVEFIRIARERVPTFAGIKYTAPTVQEYMACVAEAGDRLDILWGTDEMLISGLVAGAKAAVGSTYNYAPGLYRRIIEAFERGDLAEARRWQLLSVEMVRCILSAGGLAAQKATMRLIGYDCGPTRLPFAPLSDEQIERMAQRLREIGLAAATSGSPGGLEPI
ncbi:MAG TPA: dihydrodipicolinate synthase family protein [Phycisphaerae bacterium]|nr:dihydrodipicolinate synthase family protein [Phycisphaerae bacterium]HOM50471.1 dihydrodipicolinate synthase family protein [Phycisphaerae bacterium]HQE29957.1 dihydrodipicolinate synthase family protein [Phycisphaerae bacterium]